MLSVVLAEPGRFALGEAPEAPPAPGEARVRVHRIGVCGTDLHAFAGNQPFFSYPRILGHELGVEVLEAPPDSGLKPGDRCSVEPYLNCGRCVACRRGRPNCCCELKVLGVHADGGMRPEIAVPARKLHPSARLGYDQLALVETLGIGAHAVERGAPERGEFAAVVGAGPIGLGVIQLLVAAGAHVAVLDTSETRLAFCRDRLGLRRLVDPSREDARAALTRIGGGEAPTLVFDATGNPRSMRAAFELPANGGRLVLVGLFQGELAFDDPSFHRRELSVFASRNAQPATFRSIIALIEDGRIDTAPWITHRMTLREVPERFAAVAGDRTLLKAMISV